MEMRRLQRDRRGPCGASTVVEETVISSLASSWAIRAHDSPGLFGQRKACGLEAFGRARSRGRSRSAQPTSRQGSYPGEWEGSQRARTVVRSSPLRACARSRELRPAPTRVHRGGPFRAARMRPQLTPIACFESGFAGRRRAGFGRRHQEEDLTRGRSEGAVKHVGRDRGENPSVARGDVEVGVDLDEEGPGAGSLPDAPRGIGGEDAALRDGDGGAGDGGARERVGETRRRRGSWSGPIHDAVTPRHGDGDGRKSGAGRSLPGGALEVAAVVTTRSLSFPEFDLHLANARSSPSGGTARERPRLGAPCERGRGPLDRTPGSAQTDGIRDTRSAPPRRDRRGEIW